LSKIDDAVERIKKLECATGQEENRIAEIIEDCGVASKSQIRVTKAEELDIDGREQFCANISGESNETIIALATTGLDDYVATITEAHIE
jgi:hypothetical protein